MKLTRKVGVPVVAGGIALAGLFGPGLAGAAAGSRPAMRRAQHAGLPARAAEPSVTEQ